MVAASGQPFHVGIALTLGSFLAAGSAGWGASECEVTAGGCAAAGKVMLQAHVVNQYTEVKEDPIHFAALAQERAKGRRLAGTEMTVRDLNVAVLEHMREFRTGRFAVDNLGSFLGKAIVVVNDAIASFSNLNKVRAAANITGGIQKLGNGLLECVDTILPGQIKNSTYYLGFKDAWTKAFNDLPTASDQIEKDIRDYSEKAKPENLARVIKSCLTVAMEVTTNFLPTDAATEANKYFDAINGMMSGIVGGWSSFARRDVAAGVTFVYSGLQTAVSGLLPPHLLKNGTAVRTIFEVLDKQISKLNTYVLTFKKKLTESLVCVRKAMARTWDWPQSCGPANAPWPGFYYAGNGVCKKGSSLAQVDSVDMVLSEKNKPPEERRALCFSGEQREKRCYQACPPGYVSTQNSQMCMVTCAGEKTFPSSLFWIAGDGPYCGESPQILQMVEMELTSIVLAAIVRSIDIISKMVKEGKPNADALSSVVDEAMKLAVAFVFPMCPVMEK